MNDRNWTLHQILGNAVCSPLHFNFYPHFRKAQLAHVQPRTPDGCSPGKRAVCMYPELDVRPLLKF